MKLYDNLDLVAVWASISELANITAARPGQSITNEKLNEFANSVLEAFPEEFSDYMKVLEIGIEMKWGPVGSNPSDTL